MKEANVTVTDDSTVIVRFTVTSSAGSYSVPNLLPKKYYVAAPAEGFAQAKLPG
jgi:hypothetical protein